MPPLPTPQFNAGSFNLVPIPPFDQTHSATSADPVQSRPRLTSEQEFQAIAEQAQEAINAHQSEVPRRRRAATAALATYKSNDGDDDSNGDDDSDGDENSSDTDSKKKNFCHDCNMGFRWPSLLKEHILGHSKVKNFRCTFQGCTNAFTTEKRLKTHTKSHDPSKGLPCDYPQCEKRFKSQYLLDNHKRVHTGERPYKCLICKKHFPTISNCNQHIRTIHKKEPSEGINIKTSETKNQLT
ncbi:MAG: hypothetical protein LVQ75_04765 [Candidatus Babeliales bacterium]|jgi:hypothetical protein